MPLLLSGEVCAVLSLDSREVDRTKWSIPSNRAWEQTFRFELDKVSSPLTAYTVHVLYSIPQDSIAHCALMGTVEVLSHVHVS